MHDEAVSVAVLCGDTVHRPAAAGTGFAGARCADVFQFSWFSFWVADLGAKNLPLDRGVVFPVPVPFRGDWKTGKRPFSSRIPVTGNADWKIGKSRQRIRFNRLVEAQDSALFCLPNNAVRLALLHHECFLNDWHKLLEFVFAVAQGVSPRLL